MTHNSMRRKVHDRLRRKARRRHWRLIVERDGEGCNECGCKDDLTIDHVIPLAKGGEHVIGNLQLLCKVCHRKKDSPRNPQSGRQRRREARKVARRSGTRPTAVYGRYYADVQRGYIAVVDEESSRPPGDVSRLLLFESVVDGLPTTPTSDVEAEVLALGYVPIPA